MSAYPPALRNILKASPSLLFFFGAGNIFGLVLYNSINHPQDHMPKFHFRTHRFEKYIRYRDDKLRN